MVGDIDGKIHSKMARMLLVLKIYKEVKTHSSEESEDKASVEILRFKMESISFRYSCGDLVFYNHHSVSTVLGQRQAITYESTIEKAYYNSKKRVLKIPDICIHCGKGGSKYFLLGQTGLEERKKQVGRSVTPFASCALTLERK